MTCACHVVLGGSLLLAIPVAVMVLIAAFTMPMLPRAPRIGPKP